LKVHLFYTFLSVFIITTIVTLLGVTGVIAIKDSHLKLLAAAFFIELVGAVIAILRVASFRDPAPQKASQFDAYARDAMERIESRNQVLREQVRELHVHLEEEIFNAATIGRPSGSSRAITQKDVQPVVYERETVSETAGTEALETVSAK
jgi:hypothetical protein